MAFIGRERELAVLGSAFQRALDNGPTRVAIHGPLGIGITSLLDELESRLEGAPGVAVCRVRCYASLSAAPYGALATALGAALAAAPDDRLAAVVHGAGHDTLALVPAMGERMARLGISADPPALQAPDQLGARVREALLGVMERLAAGRQLCLIVEDLEHSDPATRGLIQALLRTSRRLSLTLIVAYHADEMARDHPARALLREMTENAEVQQVALPPLTRDELLELVERLHGERPTLGFMAAVLEGSRGNPLLATQLVEAARRLDGLRLSDPLEEIVQARVQQLDRGTALALRLLSVARRPIEGEALEGLRLERGHLPRAVKAQLIESGLVVERGGSLSVVHTLCAEAIEASTLPGQRRALHATLAERQSGDSAEPAEAAWHWARSGRPAEARAAHRAAAQRADRLDPGASALIHYSALLELGDAPGAAAADKDPSADVALLAAAACAADASGAFRRAASLVEQAVERLAAGRVEKLLGSAGARSSEPVREHASRLLEQLGRHRRSSGDLDGARAAFEQALEVAPANMPVARARALAALAQDLMLEGRFEESAATAEAARAAAAESGDEGLAELVHATDTLAVDLGFMGHIDRALGLLDEATAAARRLGRLDELMRCYANRTTLLDLDLRREEALAVVKDGMAEASRNGLGMTYGAFLRGNAADILFQLGRWEEAEAECRAALEFPPSGVAWFSPILYLGIVLVESRGDDDASRLVGRTLLQLESVPAGQWSALVLRTAVSLALWRGDLGDALSAAQQGWPRVRETEDPSQIIMAAATVLEACAAVAEQGRQRRDFSSVAEAGALAAEVLAHATEQAQHHKLPASLGARRESDLYLATARAHAERVRGRANPQVWSRLAEAWAQLPVPYQAAKAYWAAARAALPTRARRGEARRALLAAWKISGALPADPLRRALRELADRGRITLPEDRFVVIPIERERELVAVGPGPASTVRNGDQDLASLVAGPGTPPAVGRFGLSPRENSVLLVLAQGRTNREIAERLFISERTVAVHVRRILAKLGVSGRVEAAGMAIRLGLVPDDPRVVGSRQRSGSAQLH